MKNRIVILQNIPAPYRISYFNCLARSLRRVEMELHVLYCARREFNRHWIIDPSDFDHNHTFLNGVHPRFWNATFHMNPTILSVIRSLQPKLLILGGSWNLPTGLIAARSKQLRSEKILFWSEGHAEAKLTKYRLIDRLRQSFYRRFDAFIVPNRKSGDWALSQVKENRPLIFMPNTVDELFYSDIKEPQSLLKRTGVGLNENGTLFVCVAQLEKKKGLVELVESFLRLTRVVKGDQLKLAILGTGSMRAYLEKRITEENAGDHILLVGHVNKEEVRDWLGACDWFILNSHIDPNPLSPIEASFAAKPLLLSKKAGNSQELLIDGETGFVINNPHDPFVKLHAAALCSKVRRQQMGLNARRNVGMSFSRKAVADNLIAQLNAIDYL